MLTIEQIEDKIANPVSMLDLEAGVRIQNAHKVHITVKGLSLPDSRDLNQRMIIK